GWGRFVRSRTIGFWRCRRGWGCVARSWRHRGDGSLRFVCLGDAASPQVVREREISKLKIGYPRDTQARPHRVFTPSSRQSEGENFEMIQVAQLLKGGIAVDQLTELAKLFMGQAS